MSDGKGEANSNSFLANYRKLESCARQLADQQEPDVDAIMPLVTESVAAYEVCKERIRQVEEMLGKFDQEKTEG